MRGLESEFGESTNAIRVELNRLEGAGLLSSIREGNKKLYRANSGHPLYGDIHNIILKETGIDRVIEKVIHRLGNLMQVYLTGDFARGHDSQIIELILVGNGIDLEYLSRKIDQAEELVGRKLACMVVGTNNIREHLREFDPGELLLLWENEETEQNLKKL